METPENKTKLLGNLKKYGNRKLKNKRHGNKND